MTSITAPSSHGKKLCAALFAVAAGRGDAGHLLVYLEPLGDAVEPRPGGGGFGLGLAPADFQSADVSGHPAVPLAVGGAHSGGVEYFFRRLQRGHAGGAGAFGGPAAA